MAAQRNNYGGPVLNPIAMDTSRSIHRADMLVVLCAAFALAAAPQPTTDNPPLTDREKIIHVLDRLGYGPRPGDVERIAKMGLDRYLDQQLHPERIDDSELESDLAKFDILKMDETGLFQTFRDDQEAQRQRQREQAAAAKAGQSETNTASVGVLSASNQKPAQPPPRREGPRRSFLAVAELQNAKIISAVESPRQFYEVLVDFWGNHFNIDVRKGPCRVLKVADDRDVIRAHVFGRFRDLLEASAKSPAMLHYLDNFQNAAARVLSPNEIRRRQQQLAQSGAAVPAQPAQAAGTPSQPQTVGGINENYAREIMELHTLGVDGGYTQKDVQEVARCFTGWTVDPQSGEFRFTPRRHDNGEKTVLGHDIPANGGINDGEMVLDILASHPSTARFIATKLCRRFVADDPPPALVDRVANVFLQTGGDLRQVYQAIIYSPEFFSRQAFRAKIKSPFEFAVSAVRATGGKIVSDDFLPVDKRLGIEAGATFGRGMDRIASARRKSLNIEIIEMGEPLFAYQAPTGYTEDSRKWVNTGALIARMNFALALAEHKIVDVSVTPSDLIHGADIDKPGLVLDQLNAAILQGEMSAPTRATLEKQLTGNDGGNASTVNPAELTALVLGSPEFQRH
ncbi:MAG TPA: DUF1800 domain-containing protein [Verrucomicrobiae bacterium]|nr:DUF1800 domain-containing protein [Verrucomicrobiae bacterium]